MAFSNQIKTRINKLLTNLSTDFDLSKLSKSPSRFNLTKLNWFNREYLKMMTLKEFAFRASQLRLTKAQKTELDLKVCDYLFLVDLSSGKIFGEKSGENWFCQNNFSPLGSSRQDLTYLENVAKITSSVNQKIDSSKLIKIANFKTQFTVSDRQPELVDLYFYPIKESQIIENDKHGWFDLDTIITDGKLINYPIWANFCEENDLQCFEPNLAILRQYLAWSLDKNRVTKLDEVG